MTVQGEWGLDVRVLRFWNRPDREEPAMLAHDLLGSGRLDEALAVTEVALSRDPTDVDLLIAGSRVRLARGEAVTAQRMLLRAAEAEPRFAAPWLLLAEMLLARGDDERALRVLRKVTRIDPEHAEARRMWQEVSRRRGACERLARFRRNPLSEDPCLLAQELLSIGRVDDAHEVVTRALEDDADDPDALLVSARVHHARGLPSPARAALERALRAVPRWDEARALYRELFAVEAPREGDDVDIEADLLALAPPEPTLDDILAQLAAETAALIAPVTKDTVVGIEAPVAPPAPSARDTVVDVPAAASPRASWVSKLLLRGRRKHAGPYRPPAPSELFPRASAEITSA